MIDPHPCPGCSFPVHRSCIPFRRWFCLLICGILVADYWECVSYVVFFCIYIVSIFMLTNRTAFEVLNLAMPVLAILLIIILCASILCHAPYSSIRDGSGTYYVCAHRRERPIWKPYICVFASICVANLGESPAQLNF
jgi:hypothetical protein